MSSTTATAKLPALTGLRFIPALLVFLHHASVLGFFADQPVRDGVASLAHNAASIGVSFFFVLSGFVLTWSARPRDTPRRFWRRRFVKIAPNHVVVFLATLGLVVAAGAAWHGPAAIANLLLVQAWIPDLDFLNNAITTVTWSLSVEVAFYAAFPWLHRLVGRITPARLWAWLGGVCVGALAVPVVALLALPSSGSANPFYPDVSGIQMWFVYLFPLTRGFEFAAGMITARIVHSGRWPGIPPSVAAALVVGVYALAMLAPSIWTFAAPYPLPLALLVAAVATADLAGHSRVLGSRFAVWLGEISYAFFLWHVTVLFAFYAMANHGDSGQAHSATGGFDTAGAVIVIGLSLVVSVLLSWLLFVGVERKALHRWAEPRAATVRPSVQS